MSMLRPPGSSSPILVLIEELSAFKILRFNQKILGGHAGRDRSGDSIALKL